MHYHWSYVFLALTHRYDGQHHVWTLWTRLSQKYPTMTEVQKYTVLLFKPLWNINHKDIYLIPVHKIFSIINNKNLHISNCIIQTTEYLTWRGVVVNEVWGYPGGICWDYYIWYPVILTRQDNLKHSCHDLGKLIGYKSFKAKIIVETIYHMNWDAPCKWWAVPCDVSLLTLESLRVTWSVGPNWPLDSSRQTPGLQDQSHQITHSQVTSSTDLHPLPIMASNNSQGISTLRPE